MKNILLAFVLLLSFQINAQIPDSLEIDLPWEIIYLPSCDATMGEGPKSENDIVSIFFVSDTTILNDNDECIIRKKQWQIIDWLAAETYDFYQIGQVVNFANTQCETDLYINYIDFPVVLSPDNLLLELNPSHEYSFSTSDEIIDSIVIDSNSDENLELFVYDLTDNTVCKTNIYVTYCEDDVNLVFPEYVNVEFNQEPYIELSLEMLGVDIVYPCGSYETKITVGNTNSNLLVSQTVGTVVPVKVTVDLSSGIKYTKYINVNVTGIKPPPISMFIEELEFSAGETIELDIWSEEVLGLVAWQLQLEFENVEILGLETSTMFNDIPSNIVDDGNALRALWFPSNGLAFDAEANATWYTLTLKPEVDGNTFDIFKTSQDEWSKIAIENENYVFEYDADFIFNVAPRNILGVDDPTTFANIDVFPNPCADFIKLKGMSKKTAFSQIEIWDSRGKIIYKESRTDTGQDMMIDVSNLPAGILVLKVRNGDSFFTQKIIKI